MATDRLTVSVSAELSASIREIARSRGEAVSAVVAEAIQHEVRRVALEDFVTSTLTRVGSLPESDLSVADAAIERAVTRGAKAARRRRIA